MARDDPHFRLRIPEELKDMIADAAELNDRSMTAEIVDRLQKSFSRWPVIDLPDDLVQRAMRMPASSVEEIEWELQTLAFRKIQRRINEHESSRARILRELQEELAKEPEETRESLRMAVRQVLAEAGLGSLDGEDDNIFSEDGDNV